MYALLGLQQHILWLDVSVNDIHAMQVLNCRKYLLYYRHYVFRSEFLPMFLVVFHFVEQFTTTAQLAYQVKSIFLLIDIQLIYLHDIWIIYALQKLYLLLPGLDLSRVHRLSLNYSNCTLLISHSMLALPYFTMSATTK